MSTTAIGPTILPRMTRWFCYSIVWLCSTLHTLSLAQELPVQDSSDPSKVIGNTEPLRVRSGSDLIIIAHRGASGFRPEHTLASYRLAIRQGADFIEPDLVFTRDGHLIARHENELGSTTNVADHPEFADRHTTKLIDGVPTTGWFSEDFTLAEIKTLRARERIPEIRPQNTRFDGRFEIPTLSEILALVRSEEQHSGRAVGIYPETKHPTYFAKEGCYLHGERIQRSLGQALVDALVAASFTDPKRVFIQSFEVENLLELKQTIMPAAGVDFPLIQLLGDITNSAVQPASNFSRPYDMMYNAMHNGDLQAIYGDLANLVTITPETGYDALIHPDVLAFMAQHYATGIGPWKDSFLLRERLTTSVDTNNGRNTQITTRLTGAVHPYLSAAIKAGLLVHPYTLRAEAPFLTLHANNQPQTVQGEVVQLLGLGVHGFFIDQTIEGVRGRQVFEQLNQTD